ncbi:hypothetical protein IIC65_09190, partial [Candidatus Sumerlaeota bacterium]|nr:hypothetical protein [Candidatus Sumerlaeota bacterium]
MKPLDFDTLAEDGMWRMVRHLDEDDLVVDPELNEQVPVEALLARAHSLRSASPSDPVEAHR